MKRFHLGEGTVFLVPLRSGGYARGVVARASKEGKILFGYFFGPKLLSVEQANLNDLKLEKSILQVRFGDLGLINGEWSIIGQVPNWNRSEWPMSDFVRKDPLGKKKSILVHYSDNDPSHIETESIIDQDTQLEVDSMSGYGAVEIKLTNLLS